MEYLKRMARDFILKTVETTKKQPSKYEMVATRLLSKHKVNEQMPWEYDMDPAEWKTICRVCFDVVKYKELKLMKEHLINDVITNAIRHEQSMDDINFSRATINGIELFMEEIERLAHLYQSEMQEAKDARLDNLLDNVYDE